MTSRCDLRLCGALLVLLLPTPAQAFTTSDVKLPFGLSPYMHSQWRPDDGLSETAVVALSQGPDGHLWVGGTETVVSFDGLQFTPLAAFAKLPCNGVRHIHVDRTGKVWIASRRCGVLVDDHGELRRYATPPEPYGDFARIIETPDGEIWAVNKAGVSRFIGDHFEGVAGTESEAFLDLHSQNGQLVGLTTSGLFRIQPGTLTRVPGVEVPAKTEAGILYVDDKNDLWVGLEDAGLARVSPDGRVQRFTEKDGLNGTSVRSIAPDRDGNLWFATNRGLSQYREGRFSEVLVKGMSEENVQTLMFDREGNLFYGTFSSGLHQLRQRTVWTVLDGLKAASTWAVHEDRSGGLWIGTEQGDLQRFHEGKLESYGREDGIPDQLITSITEDKAGNLWVGTLAGLIRKSGNQLKTYTMAEGLTARSVNTVLEDEAGVLYVCTADGLARLEGERFVRVELPPDVNHARLRQMVDDGAGGLWIGSRVGLIHWDGKQGRVYKTVDGLISDNVSSLLRDSRGDLWVGTNNGISRFRDGKFATVQVKDGLPERNILALREDADGNLWLGTLNGIARVLRSDLEAFFEGRRTELDSMRLGTRDGMDSPECNSVSNSASMVGRDGRVYMVTMSGVAVVEPGLFKARSKPLEPVITRLVYQREHFTPSRLRPLAPGVRDLELHFTAPTFRDARPVSFRYRLDGYDKDWSETGTRRAAFYTGLKPGTYQFEVLVRNKEGIWSAQPKRLSFTLLPYFYETLWFSLLMGAALISSVGGGFYLRIRMLKRREAELLKHNEELALALAASQEAVRIKSEFVASISHELRTPLNSIINLPEGLLDFYQEAPAQAVCSTCRAGFGLGPGEVVEPSTPCPDCGNPTLQPRGGWQFRGEHAEVVTLLRSLIRGGRHLLQVINQVLDFSKLEAGKMTLQPSFVTVAELFEELAGTMEGMAKERGVTLQLLPIPPELGLRADRVKCMQVLINLVSNALKFSSKGGTVEVGAEALGGKMRLWVKDTGEGIDPAHHASIFESFRQVEGGLTRKAGGTGLGLAISKEILELHGGAISLESAPGKGSTFFATLPLEGEEKPTGASPAAKRVRRLERPLVLAIDDDVLTLETLKLALRSVDVDVETVSDPRRAQDLIAELKPQVVVLDLMMPWVSGLTLLRKLRSEPETRDLPVLVTSAYFSNREVVLSLGASWLSKPWSNRDLNAELRALLKRGLGLKADERPTLSPPTARR